MSKPAQRPPATRRDLAKLAFALFGVTVALALFLGTESLNAAFSKHLATGQSFPVDLTSTWITLAVGLPIVLIVAILAICTKPAPDKGTAEPAP